MELEVGKTYINREGDIIEIGDCDIDGTFCDDEGHYYRKDGTACSNESEFDLVEEYED